MAIPYSIQPAHPPPQQAGFGAMLALAPSRTGGGDSGGIVPMPIAGGSLTLPAHPGVSPVFDPRAFLPPVNPRDFEVQPLISIADVFGYIRKRWLRGALLGVLMAAFTFYYLGMGAKVYDAEASLLLRIQDGNVFNFDTLTSRGGAGELSAPQLMNNHRMELLSRRFLSYFYDHFDPATRDAFLKKETSLLSRKDELLKLVGLYKPGTPGDPRETFIDILLSNVRVEPVKESHVLRVQVRDHDPKLAADFANKYVEEYIRYVGEQESKVLGDAAAFLQKQSDQAQALLRVAEQKLAEYRKAEGLIEDNDSKDVSNDKVRQLNSAITEADLKLTKARSDLETLQQAKRAGRDLTELRVFADNPDVAFTRKQLDAKMAERAPLEATCGRRHPKMVGLANEIETLRATLDRSVGAVEAMIKAEVEMQQNQITDYRRQLDSARDSALDMSGKNVQQNLLRDKVRQARDEYEKIEMRRSQAALTGQFHDSGMLRVADVATIPEKPAKPNKPVAAVAAAMLFGICLIGVPVSWGIFEDHVTKLFKQQKPGMRPGQDPAQHTPYGYGYPQGMPQPQQPPPVVQPQHAYPQSLAHMLAQASAASAGGGAGGVASSSPFGIASPALAQANAHGHMPQAHAHAYAASPVAAYSPAPVVSPMMEPQVQESFIPAPPPPVTRNVPVIKRADAATTVLAKLPWVNGRTPESMLGELLKPEPVGASSALHQLTSTLELQASTRSSAGAGVILITSAESGEGKTLVAAALAAAFCHQGRRVFMMECNPSSPTLHQWFPRAAHSHGAYAHDLEALRYGHSHLFLLPGCDLPAHATNELLDGYRQWIDRAKHAVDWIILDASPLLKSFANVAPLAPLATDVIIVNNPTVSAAPKLRAGVALLQPMMSSSALRGLVVNGG